MFRQEAATLEYVVRPAAQNSGSHDTRYPGQQSVVLGEGGCVGGICGEELANLGRNAMELTPPGLLLTYLQLRVCREET